MKEYLYKNKGKIGRFTWLLLCSLTSVLLSGCSGHTIVSKTHYYPSDKDYETADFLMQIEVHGEKREAYSASTKKRAMITLWKGKNKLLSREYVCTAASLEWDVVWKELNDLKIVFFDFPEGNSIYDEKAVELPAKQIFSLRFTYDNQIKGFTEFPISQDVVRHVKGQGKESTGKE